MKKLLILIPVLFLLIPNVLGNVNVTGHTGTGANVGDLGCGGDSEMRWYAQNFSIADDYDIAIVEVMLNHNGVPAGTYNISIQPSGADGYPTDALVNVGAYKEFVLADVNDNEVATNFTLESVAELTAGDYMIVLLATETCGTSVGFRVQGTATDNYQTPNSVKVDSGRSGWDETANKDIYFKVYAALPDTTPPTINNLYTNATNSTEQYEDVSLSANCTDETAAGQIWYSKYNQSVYYNSSSYDYTNNILYTFNITINEAITTDVNLSIYCNDSVGNIQHSAWKGFTLSGDVTPPVITFVYPVNATTYNNYDGWLNFTTNENTTCSVNSSWVINSTASNTSHFYWNTDYSDLNEGIQLINVTCSDSYVNNASSFLNFSIDITNPGIITNLDNNNTVFLVLANLTIQANLTDNIKVYSLNITTPEGFLNYTSNINATSYTWDRILNTSNYLPGKHYITFEVCDAHTTKEIPDYNYFEDQQKKEVKYKFGKSDYSIRPQYADHFYSVDTYKQEDKYIFDFTKKKEYKQREETYIVKSTGFIDIIGDERFTGWLVIPGLNKWVDFETPQKYKATVKRISDNEVWVTTKGSSFKSTGDLNCLNHTVIYHIFNYTLEYDELKTENTLTTFTFDITNITTITYIDPAMINANLIYNNTVYPPTKNNGSNNVNFTVDITTPLIDVVTKGMPFYWNYTLYSTAYNTTTQNQTVSQFLIDNCTTGTNVTLTIDIYNEEVPDNKLDADVEIVIDYIINNETKNISYSLTGASNYDLCLYPSNATIYANMYLKYNTSGGFTHRYYMVNETFTNVAKNISMYNFNTQTGISDLKGTLREKVTYQYFKNIVTKIQRYYPAENVWRTVQMDESGDFGLVFFNIKEQNTDYKFIFMDRQNHILKTTESMKFVCTSAVCDLTFLIETYTGVAQDTNVSIGYTYDNNTGDINVTWIDPTGLTQTIRLLVTKETMTGTSVLCDTTVTGASGTIGCNILAYTGAILVRVFSTASPELPQFFKWINKRVGKLSTVIPAAEGAFWSFGIMLSVMGFGIALGPIGAIIAMMFGLIVLSFLDLFGVITISLVTVACIIGIIIGLKVRR